MGEHGVLRVDEHGVPMMGKHVVPREGEHGVLMAGEHGVLKIIMKITTRSSIPSIEAVTEAAMKVRLAVKSIPLVWACEDMRRGV